MEQAKQDVSAYAKAMRDGNSAACLKIEQRHGLEGYPPDLVSIGLSAAAQGDDPIEAIEMHMYGSSEAWK